MNLKLTPQTQLRLELRDAVQLGALLVTVGGSYFGLRAEIRHVSSRVEILDARLWELRGSRSASPAFFPVNPVNTCPDAPRALLWRAPQRTAPERTSP